MSLLVICEVLGLFVNTLIADDKYSVCNSENLPQLIQIQWPKKQKTLSQLFDHFLTFFKLWSLRKKGWPS